jgi:hephaestin
MDTQPGTLPRSASPWAIPAASVACVAAAAHVPVTAPHLREIPYLGVLFIVLEVALVALAVLLVLADRPAVWRLTGFTAAAALVGYGLSRTVGLPGAGDDIGNWGEPLGVVSISAEAALLLVVLVHRRPLVALPALRRPGVVAAALAAVGGTAVASIAWSTPMEHPAAAGGPSAGGMAGMSGDSYWASVAGGPTAEGVTRRYYISADLVVWNYAPGPLNQITGGRFDGDDNAQTFVGSGPGRIGRRYLKCLYRGYMDASFTRRVPRPPSDAYLGILGPVIHASVGDTIKVVFRNTCPFATSMHPHGVFYDKRSEGAPYADGTSHAATADDAVAPGHRYTYTWRVPPRAGPGPDDGSSVMWMYHGHTDEIADTYAGLMGPIVITAAGKGRHDGSPYDVDRELFTVFFIDDETKSPLLQANIRRFGTPPIPEHPEEDDDFVESNLKHSINGYLYGTMPMITVNRGDRVRWYVMGMGTEVDLHTPHWHGNDVVVGGMRMDVVSLLPASMVVADMVPDDPGVWLFHCHVNDHIAAGMLTRYRVLS